MLFDKTVASDRVILPMNQSMRKAIINSLLLLLSSSFFLAQTKPFRIGFHTDADEQTIATTMAKMNEQAELPSGIQGFNLAWTLVDC